MRNCFNFLTLEGSALVVDEYSDGLREAIRESGARKVMSLGDLRLYECPVSLLSDPEIAGLTRAVYLADSSGTLYFDGGWADQPCWFVEAYEAFITEKARQIEKADNG